MKIKLLSIAIAIFVTIIGTADWAADFPLTRDMLARIQSSDRASQLQPNFDLNEGSFLARSLAIREKLAAEDLDGLALWWQKRKIGEPHKYLLPVILSRLTLKNKYNPEHTWDVLLKLDKDKPDLYHFRSPYDVRIFFLFRHSMPKNVEASYRSMVEPPRVTEWMEQGTENHIFMQRISGLALMDGSGFPNPLPATAATNEAWLRAELTKFLTIGQGEFHSSTYYGYSIGGLLNLYDFAQTPELKELAKATLDWYAANMAIRLSWGTAGGAESRGFDRGTWDNSGLSTVAWLWWGDSLDVIERMSKGGMRVALLAALSDYRPPEELRAIAKKDIELPFQLTASHPGYYSYHESNQFWETFYITPDYSLGTLLNSQRSYQTKGTINAQYATYKLVIRDPKNLSNAVISLAGTFHTPMATGSSPGDQYLQEKGAVIYQLRLNERDKAAGVPGRSHLVLPSRYGKPQQYQNWYIWRIENVWLSAYPLGESIHWQESVSEKERDYQILAAIGTNTAWITDVASIQDYPDVASLQQGLDRTKINLDDWDKSGKLAYTSLQGDNLEMTYQTNSGVGKAKINGKDRILQDWAVLDSPYIKQELNSGILQVFSPRGKWRLQQTLIQPQWESEN
ncbi:MAG TPA: hypothetical protein DEG17_08500 [Cyanobacteria bacterium UBA11149]|nr:hypothetical protein [Cyanobacteria bacterium UBA11367]HBE59727.1 hypothetical protein [Cyanobacteria bacterium UBA11366]HBK63587.1 hypothetical protein [Cyanobacteria bacterium UBA11166]HBS72438.1 hypothetical protein [Cyanobacteria bacterium UBA11153]HBW88899.1 hypothetical protein [Cyanobacteria bacterium UBA11149]HCA94567.1 hypothetical protein [Cyanobacteria bacterium UBA9226]